MPVHRRLSGFGRARPKAQQPPGSSLSGGAYLTLLNWAFALFSSTRLLTYLPTLWAIQASGDSSQHSLLTWSAWVASNTTMAAWLFEHNGRRWNKAIVVTAGNAVMCGAACLLIVHYR